MAGRAVRDPDPRSGGDGTAGVLTIDLVALAANRRLLAERAPHATVAGVVKADGYGLGASPVAGTLFASGCRTFFVAHLAEALALLGGLPGADILVLNGLSPGAEARCADAGIQPVLNSLDQVARWSREARRRGKRLPAALQVDSGMARLGLSPSDVEAIGRDRGFLEGIDVRLVMSHLACADERNHPANAAQLGRFTELSAMLPDAPRSLANSAGIFLGEHYHFDLVRPGIALYGGKPFAGTGPNPMRAVARLQARVVQVRDVPSGTGIGYGHAAVASKAMRLATIGIGYADGWPRRLGGRIAAWAGDARLPIVGRVSMDSIVLDAGDAGLRPGDLVDLVGPRQGVDAVAAAADTIPYEILTSLGRRFERRYVNDGTGAAS
ncbi:alanine racemase [Aureimonas leprariae]|uniref:Alanine racemase n=1 Tax=Plantimonas leprariae TaxID=2615207 RepID=A0A7V7PNG3_9HYPH|nr:alanine racemase [Aureimonas leprariae]KAB0679135.1 alanine racemase [Aureimonas leprariae]